MNLERNLFPLVFFLVTPFLSLVVSYNFTNQGGCGVSKVAPSRIVGGQASEKLAWPWQALLLKHGQAICGGSLVSDQYVLTAAHCISLSATPSTYTVRLGEHDKSVQEGTEVELSLERIILPASYDRQTNDNDLAMLKLKRKLDFNGAEKHLTPVCLPQQGMTLMTKHCYATGWGTLSQNGRTPSVLQQVNLPLISDSACKQCYPNTITENMVCAGDLSGGRDTCQGDSGGPLQCPLANNVWIQWGITSFGHGCANANSPGVYTKVYNYVKWINEAIGTH